MMCFLVGLLLMLCCLMHRSNHAVRRLPHRGLYGVGAHPKGWSSPQIISSANGLDVRGAEKAIAGGNRWCSNTD
jgi:hypothetical protein